MAVVLFYSHNSFFIFKSLKILKVYFKNDLVVIHILLIMSIYTFKPKEWNFIFPDDCGGYDNSLQPLDYLYPNAGFPFYPYIKTN